MEDTTASPNKRIRLSPQDDLQQDFVPLGGADDDNDFETSTESMIPTGPASTTNGHNPPDRKAGNWGNGARNDLRNAKDRPKSQQSLPGHEQWVLVRTKYGRRFAHNVVTKESFWRIPHSLMPAVYALERLEREDQAEEVEKAKNAAWAEEQLKAIRVESQSNGANGASGSHERQQRRRSESLQREDEEAMMAELAAQAEKDEEDSANAAELPARESEVPRIGDYGSDSEYEYVEVTDTEGEDHDEDEETTSILVDVPDATVNQEPAPVEFTEDDIAYQLAAMGADYGLDPGEYGGDADEDGYESGAEGLPLSDEEAANIFRELLDDHGISPYTPWDKLIADESPDSIMLDDRYTVLPSTRARKEVWEQWTRDKAAQLRVERERMEKLDPRIPYLAFLADNATPKLYWPEFKRKYRKDSVMTDRKLSDKEREKLYRDHVARLKLPEATRKADLKILLKAQASLLLNRETSIDALPKEVLTNLHFISLPAAVRDPIVQQYIATLPKSL
ncbi:hypothetical protein LTR95_008523 [Oleoguttula sp. CCFEE 5521]